MRQEKVFAFEPSVCLFSRTRTQKNQGWNYSWLKYLAEAFI